MKRIFLILCILCIPVFLFGQDPWVDSSGSTWTPTASQVQWEIKDVFYNVHDRTVGALKITISSQTSFVIDELGRIWVRSSTSSLTGIYQGGNTAIVRAGDTDELSPNTQGLQTQSNMHVYNSNKWHRLIGQSTDYHNLRVTIYDSDRPWEINDFDSDDQAEGRNGVIVYSYISGWDATNDNWDRLRIDELFRLIISTNNPFFISNFPTDYPDATAQSSLSSIDTNTDNTYNQLKTSVTTSYKVDNSSYVYRDVYANGSLTVNFNVKSIGVYSQGGDSTVSWDGGDTINVWEGIPFGDVPIDETFDSPVTFTYTLSAPTTFSIYIRGRL